MVVIYKTEATIGRKNIFRWIQTLRASYTGTQTKSIIDRVEFSENNRKSVDKRRKKIVFIRRDEKNEQSFF